MLSPALASSLRAAARSRAVAVGGAAVAAAPPAATSACVPALSRTYAKVRSSPRDEADKPQASPNTAADEPPAPAASSSSSSQSSRPAEDPTASAPESEPATSVPPPPRQGPSAFDIDSSLMAIADQAAEGGSGGDGGGGGRTGARARSDAQQSSIERQRKNTRRIFGLIFLGGSGVLLGNMARDWDTVKERERFAGNPLSDSAFGRMRLRINAMWEDFQAPVWEKLLPDPLPFPYQRPYTLVVDLDELLVHSHWTREHGWRTAKRPGLDYFLAYLSQFWEIVLFTTQPYYVVAPVIEKLDPDRRYIAYTLFRESCRTHQGKVVKDLSALNRDLSKVVVLDTEADRYSMQPENGILMKKWDGSRNDAELVGMIPFLEAIGIYQIPDVRSPIKAYEGQHIPTEYNKRQREVKEAEDAAWLAKHGPGGKSSGGAASTLSSLLGGFKSSGKAPAAAGTTTASGRPKTFYELERDRYQAGYLEDQKYWKENGEALRKQAKEEQERQMKEMKLSAWGMLTGQGMKPPEQGEGPQQQQK